MLNVTANWENETAEKIQVGRTVRTGEGRGVSCHTAATLLLSGLWGCAASAAFTSESGQDWNVHTN